MSPSYIILVDNRSNVKLIFKNKSIFTSILIVVVIYFARLLQVILFFLYSVSKFQYLSGNLKILSSKCASNVLKLY